MIRMEAFVASSFTVIGSTEANRKGPTGNVAKHIFNDDFAKNGVWLEKGSDENGT